MLEGIKFMMTTFGVAVGPIIDLVKAITPSEQNRITKDSERIQDEFGRLDKDLEGDDEEINRRLNQYERNQARQTATTTPSTTTQTSRNTPTGSPDRSFREPSTPTRTDSRVPKFAAGGRVEPRRTDTGTQPAARKSMTAATTTGRQTDGSVRSKRAVQTVNYFSFFNNNTRASEAIVEKDAKNKDTFKEILTSLKTIQDIRKQIGDDDSDVPGQRPGTSPGQPSPGEPIDVDPNEVIGTVGYTGNVRPAGPDGTHIHIENNTTRGGNIPLSVKNNVFVSGIPMPQRLRFSSGIMEPDRPNHMGEDWAGEPNQPITLGGGLKFVQYIPDNGNGYGNRVIIQAPDGTQYSLNHLNSGPRNLRALQERQNQQRQNQQSTPGVAGRPTGQQFSGEATYYGRSDGFHGRRTSTGEIFNTDAYTAAIQEGLKNQFGGVSGTSGPAYAIVENLDNGRKIVVKINDVGPLAPGRVIDLSEASSKYLLNSRTPGSVRRVRVTRITNGTPGPITNSTPNRPIRPTSRGSTEQGSNAASLNFNTSGQNSIAFYQQLFYIG